MSLLKQEVTYFDEKDKPQAKGPVPVGKYTAHIKSVNKKFVDRSVNSRADKGAKHLCDLLEVVYTIADDGDQQGRQVWSNAIWIFKNPNDDIHTANPGGNYRYSTFLEVVDYPLEDKEIKGEDGKKRTVKELPIEVDPSYVVGKPVMIEVKHRAYTSGDGEERIGYNEVGIFKWEDGSVVEVNDDEDLPF